MSAVETTWEEVTYEDGTRGAAKIECAASGCCEEHLDPNLWRSIGRLECIDKNGEHKAYNDGVEEKSGNTFNVAELNLNNETSGDNSPINQQVQTEDAVLSQDGEDIMQNSKTSVISFFWPSGAGMPFVEGVVIGIIANIITGAFLKKKAANEKPKTRD